MNRTKWFLVGLLGFCIPALMAPSGGFPFFPTFGKVTVRPSANAVNLTLDNTGTFNSQAAFSTATVIKARIGVDGSAGGLCAASAAGDLCIRSTSGTIRASTDNGVSSQRVATTVHANVALTGATCSINSQIGMSTTCTHLGTGSYQISSTSAFATQPDCTATTAGTLYFVSVAAGTTNQTITTFNTSAVAADVTGGLNVVCIQ